MYLIFDTETTDLYKKDLPHHHPNQARMVQFACLLVDSEFKDVAAFSTLIRPDEWSVQPGAEAVHGISTEKCNRYGIPIDVALDIWFGLTKGAQLVVAHNIAFDSKILDVETTRLGIGAGNWGRSFCTMQTMTNICKLPSKYPGKFKWPKLSEAYKHCYAKEMSGAHDAMSDVVACKSVLQWIRINGLLGTLINN